MSRHTTRYREFALCSHHNLASYVYHYPADDGLNLKGPDPKHATDERTRLIAGMLFFNGIIAAITSFFGTGNMV